MSKSGGIKAGKAYVSIYADSSPLVRGMKIAERKLRRFGANVTQIGMKMTAVGAAMSAPFALAVRSFSKMGDSLAKMSKRTGVSVESLSALKFAAQQSGVEFSAFENGFKKMQRSIYDAGRGLSTQVDAFKDLGLTFKDLNGLSPEKQFMLIADKISKIEDPTKRAAIAMTLLGRSGTALLPMMMNGASGIKKLKEEAKALDLIISATDARAAENLTDAFGRLSRVSKVVGFNVGAVLAPAIEKIVDKTTSVLVLFDKWIKKNRGLVVSFAKIAVGVVAAGASLVVLGGIISGVGATLGALVTVVSGVGAAFTAAFAAIASPIGIAIGLVAALGVAFGATTNIAAKASKIIGDTFSGISSDVKDAMDAIKVLLTGGDVLGAAKVFWAVMKLEWAKGSAAIVKTFNTAILDFVDRFKEGMITTLTMIDVIKNKFKATAAITAGIQKKIDIDNESERKRFAVSHSLMSDKEKRLAYKKIEIEDRKAKHRVDMGTDSKINKQESIDELTEANKKLIDKMVNVSTEAIDNAQKDVEKAKKEYAELIKKSKDTKKTGVNVNADLGAGGNATASVADAIANALKGIKALQQSTSTSGTFSAYAVSGLGTGNVVNKIAQATRETADNTRRIIKGLQTSWGDQSGMTFTA